MAHVYETKYVEVSKLFALQCGIVSRQQVCGRPHKAYMCLAGKLNWSTGNSNQITICGALTYRRDCLEICLEIWKQTTQLENATTAQQIY